VNGISDGGSGRASGSSDGAIAELTKVNERNPDVSPTTGVVTAYLHWDWRQVSTLSAE